jgi:hypothetical protein
VRIGDGRTAVARRRARTAPSGAARSPAGAASGGAVLILESGNRQPCERSAVSGPGTWLTRLSQDMIHRGPCSDPLMCVVCGRRRAGGPGSVLVESSVVEQRHRAVLAVLAGESVRAWRLESGASRQTLHKWLGRYRPTGWAGRWIGPSGRGRRRGRRRSRWRRRSVKCAGSAPAGASPPGFRVGPRAGRPRVTDDGARALVRDGLAEPRKRGRRREGYRRWERDALMALRQLDVVDGVFLLMRPRSRTNLSP